MGAEESKFARPPTEWEPYSHCDSSVNWEAQGKPPFALIILNQKISNKKLFFALWRNCEQHARVVGGGPVLSIDKQHICKSALTEGPIVCTIL